MVAVPLFVELCAGLASVSGVLQHGRHWMPEASRAGVKTKYASATLAALGLAPSRRAASYLWCEPDHDVSALLVARTQPEVLAEAGRIMREWTDCTDKAMRAVWDSSRHIVHQHAAPRWGDIDATRLVAWLLVTNWTRGDGGLYIGPGAPPTINPAACAATLLQRLAPRAWPDVRVVPRAIHPDALGRPVPAGTVIYMDPPYRGTTPYQHDMDRAEVVALATAWAAAGALVGVAEAEPVAELVVLGWHAVDLTSARYGQARPKSSATREWLTMSAPPVRVPAQQVRMF